MNGKNSRLTRDRCSSAYGCDRAARAQPVALAAAAPRSRSAVDKAGPRRRGHVDYDPRNSRSSARNEAPIFQAFSPTCATPAGDIGFIRLAVEKKGITSPTSSATPRARLASAGDATAMGTTRPTTSVDAHRRQSERAVLLPVLHHRRYLHDSRRAPCRARPGITATHPQQPDDRPWLGPPALVTHNGGTAIPTRPRRDARRRVRAVASAADTPTRQAVPGPDPQHPRGQPGRCPPHSSSR